MNVTAMNISRRMPVIIPICSSSLPLTLWLEALRMVKGRIRLVQMRVRYLRWSGLISLNFPAAKPMTT